MKQSCHILSGNVYTICQENYRFADNYSFVLFNCILQRTALENPSVESAKNIPPFNVLFRKRERHRLRPVALNFWSRRKKKLHGRKVAANKIEGRGSERLCTFLCVLRETDRETERERETKDWVWSRKVSPSEQKFLLRSCTFVSIEGAIQSMITIRNDGSNVVDR